MYVLEDVQKYYQGIDILHISQQRGVIIIDEVVKLCTSKSVTFEFETKNHQNFTIACAQSWTVLVLLPPIGHCVNYSNTPL